MRPKYVSLTYQTDGRKEIGKVTHKVHLAHRSQGPPASQPSRTFRQANALAPCSNRTAGDNNYIVVGVAKVSHGLRQRSESSQLDRPACVVQQ